MNKTRVFGLTGLLLLFAVAFTPLPDVISHEVFATCLGKDPCRACKNCKYCGHCADRGGECGVCKRR